MLKAVLIIGLVIALLLGGILALRGSGRAGMPSEEVLKRAAQRERELQKAEKDRGE